MLGHLNGLSRFAEGDSSGAWLTQVGDILKDVSKTAGSSYEQYLRSRSGQPITSQPPPPPQVYVAPTDWSKVLLYGGIAVGGVAGVLWILKRRKR